jgi:hypothetical protein
MDANHAMALVRSTLKKAEEEVSPFLSSAEKRIPMREIQNVSGAMKTQGACHSGI